MSTNFAKTLVWKNGNDVKLWRHKQRTPNTNDYHMTLKQTPHENFLRTPLAGEISCLSMFIILKMSLFCILFLMYRLMLQVPSLKSSSWIACTASLMVYLALSFVSISLTRHSYWSLILRSWLAKPVVCKLTFAWVTETPDPSKLSTIAFTSGKFAAFNLLPHLVLVTFSV